MRRGLPLGPTLLVAVAVPIMIALGMWQLQRLEWKTRLLAQLTANAGAPVIALPGILTPDLGFRRVTVSCARLSARGPAGAATTVGGEPGFRYLATCHPARGAPLPVSLGVTRDPAAKVALPPRLTLTGRLIPHGTPPFLLIADRAVPPLRPEAAPGVETIANNHLSYAVQWFLFAATLAVIYAVYLGRWRRSFDPPAPRR